MNRRVLAISVAGVWLGAMAWLVRREYWRPAGTEMIQAALRVGPSGSFYALTMGGQQIGYASSTVDTVGEGIRLQDVMVVEVPALGSLHRTDVRTEALLTRGLRLKTFAATMQGETGRFAATGEVHGDTVLLASLESEGNRQEFRVPLTRPIVLPALVPIQVVLGGKPKVGSTYSIEMFDPLTLADRPIQIAVTGESTLVVPDSADSDSLATLWFPVRWDTLHAWRIEQRAGGLAMETWIDDAGRVISATSALGFRMERTAYEIAYENFRKRDTVAALAAGLSSDIIQTTAIASNVRLGRGRVAELRARLGGVDLTGFDLAGDRQSLAGDTLTVRVEPPDSLRPRYRLSTTRLTNLQAYLDPEPLVQSDDPRIAAQARRIVGSVTDPRRAAQLLNDWVYQTVEKKITVSVPSAVQVLETRRGDCNEHTVLFVAMARSLGIPTRTAAGLVHLNGRFYYHAWPEVYLRGWVAVDPTFGQFPADAAHLRFTIGGLARQIDLLRLIGRLDIDVIDSRETA